MAESSITVHQIASNNRGVNKIPPPINGGTTPAPVGGLYNMVAAILDSQYEVQTKSVCEHHKNDVYDPELSLFSF